MTDDAAILDAVVVGAGSAGLGVSQTLTRRGLRHLVLERGRVGETWRTQRWDSFRMNTPNAHAVLPGDNYSGPDPEGVLTRDGFVALLEDYAERHRLPVAPDTPVTELTATPEQGVYHLTTPRGAFRARNVVIASGSLNCPTRPSWAAAVPRRILQIDASAYRRAADLPGGAVLVVGNAQSGGQIAEDLAEAGRGVFLATGRVGRAPRRYRGRDISVWMLRSGLYDLPRTSFLRPSGGIIARPLLGAVHTISLQSLSAQGVILLGRLAGVEPDGRLAVAGDLEENIRFADAASADLKARVDAFIAGAGIEAPAAEPDPAENVTPRLPDPPIRSLDLAGRGIGSVIWCTGFTGDFGWARLPGLLDARGQPLQTDGVAAPPGIYFAGLDFASTRKSGTILAITEEADRLVKHMAGRV